MRHLAFLSLVSLATVIFSSSNLLAGHGCGCEATCGCEAAPPCHRRCHHRRCCSAAPIDRSAALPLSGPVYESVAAPRMAAVPMVAQYALVSSVQPYAVADVRTAEARSESTCADSHQRLNDLEARVRSMRTELNEIHDTMQVQLSILKELKARLPAQ